MKSHSSQWVLRSAEIACPNLGITNNSAESLNSIIKSLREWRNVPLDLCASALYYLCFYYYRELEHAFHQRGQMQLKEKFSHYLRSPHSAPRITKAIPLDQIVATLVAQNARENDSFEENDDEGTECTEEVGDVSKGIGNKIASEMRVSYVERQKAFVVTAVLRCSGSIN